MTERHYHTNDFEKFLLVGDFFKKTEEVPHMVKSQVNEPKKTPQTTLNKVRQDIFLQHFFLFNKKYSFMV